MARGRIAYRGATALALAAVVAGAGALLYPAVSSAWNSWRDSVLTSGYEERVAADPDVWQAEREAARAYNASLLPAILPDSFARASDPWSDDEEYASLLDVDGEGMMCYVEIPSIGVEVPVYHGADSETLARGAGHLPGSSLPVGGESTHAVISAHCGLPGRALFTDLNLLEVGDRFYIHVLGEVLAYEVDLVSVVEPDDTSALAVEDGCEYVTLVTCTPYGVNSHRLLVRGHRVEYDSDAGAETRARFSIKTSYLVWALGAAGSAGGFLALSCLVARRRGRRRGAA